MIRVSEIRLPLDHQTDALVAAAAARLGVRPHTVSVARRGYDARSRGAIMLVYTLDCAFDAATERDLLARFGGDTRVRAAPDLDYRFRPEAPAAASPRPVVIGAGPCGLFAALVLAQWGLRPIVVERGRPVRQRTADTFRLWRRGVLDPDSNVQFGEGGAGTFSDGKLWSGVRDPERLGRKVLTELVRAGAPDEILFVSKPHVGTFRLVTVVTRMRDEIERLGGSYRFETRVDAIDTAPDGAGGWRLAALRLGDGEVLPATHAILAPATPPVTPSPGCTVPASRWTPSRSRSASASSTRRRRSIAPASARTPATRCSAPPTTSSCIMPPPAAPSTRSACARAARWSRPPPSQAAS